MRFELDRLTSYDDAALLAELRRVAALVPGTRLRRADFERFSKVSASTLARRFGTWREALAKAGLVERFDSSTASRDREEVLAEIRRVASQLGSVVLRKKEFLGASTVGDTSLLRLFGSWRAALREANLQQVSLGRRYTDDECFENLLAVWTHLGRAPRHREMTRPPSVVGPKAYVRRWGTWNKALQAFLAKVNSDAPEVAAEAPVPAPASRRDRPPAQGPRDVPLGLRYRVLARDRFRCVLCGRSPATDLSVVLHVDHIHPWSGGGATTLENLRSLCTACNLGKRDRIELERR